MADFFTQLSRRALGRETVLQPRSQIYGGDAVGTAFMEGAGDGAGQAERMSGSDVVHVAGHRGEQGPLAAERGTGVPESSIAPEVASLPSHETGEAGQNDHHLSTPTFTEGRTDGADPTLLPPRPERMGVSIENAFGPEAKEAQPFEGRDQTTRAEQKDGADRSASEPGVLKRKEDDRRGSSEPVTSLPRLVQPTLKNTMWSTRESASAILETSAQERGAFATDSVAQRSDHVARTGERRAEGQTQTSQTAQPQFTLVNEFSTLEKSGPDAPGEIVSGGERTALVRRQGPESRRLVHGNRFVPQQNPVVLQPNPAMLTVPKVTGSDSERQASSRTINVTIGRIEVRATPEPRRVEYAQPPKREKAKAPSGLSLVEYLKRYNEKNG